MEYLDLVLELGFFQKLIVCVVIFKNLYQDWLVSLVELVNIIESLEYILVDSAFSFLENFYF
jgi:hypothetical protein